MLFLKRPRPNLNPLDSFMEFFGEHWRYEKMARNRREYKEEPNEERVITVEQALEQDRASTLYDKLSEIVKSHGVDLLLKVRLISSDYRTAGFIDDVSSTDEVQNFIENPEGYLKSHYGEGSYRIDIIDGISKKYISHLKIDISTPREKINRQPDYLGEVTKAYRDGVSLGKSALPTPNNQPSLDLTKLFEIVMIQQEKSREREEKVLERIRADEVRLRERELQLIEKAYAGNTDLSKHLQPFLMGFESWGKMISSSMSMIERTVEFRERFNSEPSDRSFLERLLIGLGEKLLDSNPQLFEKLSSTLTQTNTPNTPVTTHIPLGNNQSIESKEHLNSNNEPQAQAHQFNFENLFPAILAKYIKRASRDEDPMFCADSLLADLEDLVSEQVISESQLNQVHQLLISDNLEPYIRNFFPDIVKYKAWIINFQASIKKEISEPIEPESKTTN